MSAIKVRTAGSHPRHIAMNRTKTCGCATKENTKDDTKITRCPCGCAYLTEIVNTIIPFTCYDCKRAVYEEKPRTISE